MTNPNIKVFSTNSCPYCSALKNFLRENNIEFKDFNVAEDVEAQKEMIEKTGQLGVPVTNIGDQWVIGFDRDRIADLLGIK